MELFSIVSGSSGNCICVGNDRNHVMIDAGISGKRIEEGMNAFDYTTADMDGILVTHEHSDHIAGLGVVARKYGIPIYTTRGTADAIYQNLDFLRKCHEPYVIITSGDCIYKMDFDKILDYHIKKKADITVAVKDIEAETEDLHRFGVVRMAEDGRIVNFEEKPLVAQTNTVSIGVYVIRRRLLIELIQKAHEEKRNDFVQDILVRYKDVKKIFGYKHEGYWENIATIDSYYHANMDFLKRDVRDYFFHDYPNVYSKIEDLPPAKFNPGSKIKNSLVSSGCIVNGEVQDSILFKKVYVGNNCVIKNSIILNDVYIGDNTVIENCIVESRDTIRANASYIGEDGKIQIVVEKSDRYIL